MKWNIEETELGEEIKKCAEYANPKNGYFTVNHRISNQFFIFAELELIYFDLL